MRSIRGAVPANVRERARVLLVEFEALFGSEHGSLETLKVGIPAHRLGRAYHALKGFKDNCFDTERDITGNASDFGMTCGSASAALHALTGRPWTTLPLLRRPQGLTELPPTRFRPKVLELCAGAGGMALGLERAGFRAVGLIEWDRQAAATLRKNRPGWRVIEADIRKVDFTKYKGKIHLLAGGVPCTPFSTMGERKGKTDENDLFPEAVRAVKEVQPQAFIFENVEGLLHASHADHVAGILRQFSNAGYDTVIERVNTRDYGLAQIRSRILLIGLRKELSGAFRMPPKFVQMAPDIGVVLGDLMGENGWSGAKDWARRMSETPVYDRAGNLIRTGILADTIRGYKGSGHVNEKARWLRNGVAYAPIAKAAPMEEEAQAEGFVPRLTNRMRAVLQGFPDDWQFVGGIPAVADQIGNAVAPIIAQAVGLAMFSALRGFGFDWEAMLGEKVDRRVPIDPPTLVTQDEGWVCLGAYIRIVKRSEQRPPVRHIFRGPDIPAAHCRPLATISPRSVEKIAGGGRGSEMTSLVLSRPLYCCDRSGLMALEMPAATRVDGAIPTAAGARELESSIFSTGGLGKEFP